ncbi:hypothetical protein [Bacillus sp. m3-13]|uniref:hypothetical protein n=1 Tax=Bacillus sp. m3-13 TaxID=406124 RepID=UPI0003098F56|nr:hypothetical protein [Bacillus sp. m3-13]
MKEKDIIKHYCKVIDGKQKALPKGSLDEDSNIIILLRYVLESKLRLTHNEIPLVSRQLIKENKMYGLLSHYRSIPKLIKFVYKRRFEETDFQRVSSGYWSDTKNIKSFFEKCLIKYGYTKEDIPQIAKVNLLVEWGFSKPLKRYGDSPFRLMNALYPREYKVFDFDNVPQRFWDNPIYARERILEMIRQENIIFKNIPSQVKQEMLYNYGFSTLLKKHKGSSAKLLISLFPADIKEAEFTKPNGYWKDINNVRKTIDLLLEIHNIPLNKFPKHFTKSFFQEQGLYGLIQEFNASPIELVNKLYPEQFDVTEFQRVPNRYWYSKENRVKALRNFCWKRNISREYLQNFQDRTFVKSFRDSSV